MTFDMAEATAACNRVAALLQLCVIAGSFESRYRLIESDLDEVGAIAMLHADTFGPAPAPAPWPRLLAAPFEGDGMDREDAAEIARLCVECGAPDRMAEFLADGLTVDEVLARLGYTDSVRNLVALARRTLPSLSADFADTAIADRVPLTVVREVLFETIAAASETSPIVGSKLTGDGTHRR